MVEWIAFSEPAIDLTLPVLGYFYVAALLIGVVVVLVVTLSDFQQMASGGGAAFVLSLLAAPLLAEVIVLKIGAGAAALGLLPVLIAAIWSGRSPAAVVGLVTGAAWMLFDTGRLSQPFETALVATLIAVLVRQPYQGVVGRLLRAPLVTALIVGLFVWWPLTVLGILMTGPSEPLMALIQATSLSGGVLTATLTMALIAGGLTQIVVLVTQRPEPEQLIIPPWERHLDQRTLWTLIPLLVIAVFALVGWVGITSYTVATRVVVEQIARDAENAGSSVPFFMQVGRGLIRSLAVEEPLPLEENLRTVPFFQQLIYVTPDGSIAAIYPTGTAVFPDGLAPTEDARVAGALSSGAPAEVLIEGTSSAVLSFVVPVESGGVLVGRTTLDGNLFLEPTADLLREGIVGEGEGFIISEQNTVLLYPAQPDAHLTEFVPGNVTELTRPGDPGQVFRQTAADGSTALLYVLPVEGQAWSVVIRVPNEVAAALAVQIAVPTLGILLILSTAAVGLVLAIARRVTDPLERLLESVEQIERGDLDEPVEISGEDEIGRLGLGFEQMRRSLRSRLNEQERLLNVTLGVSSSLELFRAMPSILSSALELTDALGARIVLRDPAEVYATGLGASSMAVLDEPLFRLVEKQGIMVISQIWRAEGVFDGIAPPEGVGALVAFPLRGENTLHGMLWLAYPDEHVFEEYEMTYLTTLAGQAAVAVSNARLFAAAEERRRELEAVLISTSDGIIVTDTDGRIALMNPAAADLFDVPHEAVRGYHVDEVIEPALLADHLSDLKRPAAELEIPGPEGRTLLINISTIVSDGSLAGRVAVLRDITELKELDNIKTVFLRMVSHDLRSPLTYMRGYITMMPLVGDLNERQIESLDKIETGIARIAQMTERLTQLSKLRFGDNFDLDRALIDPAELISDVVSEQSALAQQGKVELVTDVENGMPMLYVDPMLMRQAVANLVGNAVKYTPEGGRVRIDAHLTADDSQRAVHIAITDTGIGIRTEDQPSLFNPFYRVPHREGDPPRPHGSGLGLALVKSIADAHGGRVGVRSTFGEGSTFSITVPVVRPRPGELDDEDTMVESME